MCAVGRHDGGQLLQPDFVLAVEAFFVVVDEHRGRRVHRVYQREPFPDTAFTEAFRYFWSYVNEGTAGGHL